MGTAAPAEELDENLWADLPEEVMDLVVAYLPLKSLFRMRCVCKRWTSIIFSPKVLEIHFELPSPACLLQSCKVDSRRWAAIHDPVANNWQLLPLDFVPKNAHICAGAAGLLCYQREHGGKLVLSVSNPLTRQTKDLPVSPHPDTYTCFVKLVVDKWKKVYTIIRVSQLSPLISGQEKYTEVYDSRTDCWRSGGRAPTNLRYLVQGCSVCNNILFCLSYNKRRVIAYHIDEGVWTIMMPPKQDLSHESNMVDCNGRLFLSGIRRGLLLVSIEIWEWKICDDSAPDSALEVRLLPPTRRLIKGEWKAVGRMPPNLFQELSSSEGLFYHVGVGDWIYSACLSYGGPSSKLVVYSLQNATWSMVSDCPIARSDDYLKSFEFSPTLNVFV